MGDQADQSFRRRSYEMEGRDITFPRVFHAARNGHSNLIERVVVIVHLVDSLFLC